MTTDGALPIAVEARELGKSAHKRLDGINGSIERLNNKVDVVDSKLDSVLITLAKQDGKDAAWRGFTDSRRFMVGLVVTVLTSAVAAFLFTLVVRSH